MTSRRAFTIGLATSTLLALPACGVLGRSLPTYRYRLTVEVDTPEGLKSGSSVIEVRTEVADRAILPDAKTLDIQVTGEAVTVDLGQRGLLFALLQSEERVGWAGGVMELVTPRPKGGPHKDAYANWHAAMTANTGRHVLPRYAPQVYSPPGPPDKPGDPPRDYPLLVRFRDVADPTTVERVDPDDLAKSFGPDVKLRKITVELTENAVTTEIEKRLGWLPTVYSKLPDESFHPKGIPVGDFQRLFTTRKLK